MNKLWTRLLFLFSASLIFGASCAVRPKIEGPASIVPARSDSPAARAELGKIKALPSAYAVNKRSLDIYLSWIDRTVLKSARSKSYAIIVDKAAYRLFLIKDGKSVAKFPIELGGDPINDKMREGDRRTPEGMYKITRRLQGAQTSWFKALEIDYPSPLDLMEFKEWQKRGEVRRSDRVGGFIQIHGEGSGLSGNAGGQNWTDGCVSLSNPDMSKLFSAVANSPATPVTIVRYGTEYFFARN